MLSFNATERVGMLYWWLPIYLSAKSVVSCADIWMVFLCNLHKTSEFHAFLFSKASNHLTLGNESLVQKSTARKRKQTAISSCRVSFYASSCPTYFPSKHFFPRQCKSIWLFKIATKNGTGCISFILGGLDWVDISGLYYIQLKKGYATGSLGSVRENLASLQYAVSAPRQNRVPGRS